MKNIFESPADQPVENGTSGPNDLSRRQWLGKVSVPVLMAAGAGMLGAPALAATAAAAPPETLTGAKVYNIRDFGAKGDGKTLDTQAVQAAIDRCNQEQGGTVLVPAGDFVIGTVELKSNVTLHLSVQGKLLGSPDKNAYSAGKGVPPGNGNIVLLYAANAENVSVEGRGTLDGNGAAFYTGKGDNTGPNSTGPGYTERPHLAIFYKCNNLLLRDAFFTKSAYHCFRILQCEQVTINGVRIYNRVNKNNDGFHFNNCKYVRISNCEVRCQDDACALFGSNQFVTVTNCAFSTRWSIFRFGSGEAQNIAISNCLIYETYGCPIKISSGNARLENLTFSNIIMRNVTGPIGIGFSGTTSTQLSAAEASAKSAAETSAKAAFVRNIVFNAIRATVVAAPVNHPDIPFDVNVYPGERHSCITLNALGNNYIENISFTDIHITYAGGGSKELAAKRNIPQTAKEYFTVWDPEPSGPPVYGFYARNVKGLTLQNVKLVYQDADARPAVLFDHVEDASVANLSVQGSLEANAAIRLADCREVLFSGTRLLSPAPAVFSIEGACHDIVLDGGDLYKAPKPAVFASAAAEKAVRIRM